MRGVGGRGGGGRLYRIDRPAPSTPLREQIKILREILPLLWPSGAFGLKARVVTALSLIVAGKLVNVAAPILYRDVIDALTHRPDAVIAVPVALILGYGLARVAVQAAGELRDLVFAKVEQRSLRLLSLRVFEHLHVLSLRFHLDRQTGGLSRTIERGSNGVESLMGFLLFTIAPALLEIILVSIVLWRFYSFSFTAATLAIVVVYAVYTASLTQWRIKFRREMNAQDTEANGRAIDSLLNYETVKYFTNESHERERFDEAKQAYVSAALKNQLSLSLFNIGQAGIVAIGMLVIMFMAGSRVADGQMTIGDFVLANTYLLQLYAPLGTLGLVYRNLRQALTDVEQMYELLNERPEVEDEPEAVALPDAPARIVFDHVSFSYDSRRPILHDVSFVVEPGRRVALVGPTGSGKTTISRLLFRFYDPQSGSISIAGEDLRGVTQASLRKAIGVVPQDTVLFNDTIYYNIAYGRIGATPEEVEEAAARAELGPFIASLPEGYETRVGERGLKLSGGEKQRVAIARVLLKAPRILIFDEATSSLDTRTEVEIQASLDQVARNHTTLIIAHRLSTIMDADEIIVLEAGRIVERGTHDALLERDGAYAAMWFRQRFTPLGGNNIEQAVPGQ